MTEQEITLTQESSLEQGLTITQETIVNGGYDTGLNSASGNPIVISVNKPIYIADLEIDTTNNPDITFSSTNLLDNRLFLDRSKWRTIASKTYVYDLDLPAGTYTVSFNKKLTSVSGQWLRFQISSNNFWDWETAVNVINNKVWLSDNKFTFTLESGEKARFHQYTSADTPIANLIDSVMIEEGEVDPSPYVTGFTPFTISYKDTKSLRIAPFDKYVKITNSDNLNMNVTYNLGSSLYEHIGKTPIEEAYSWIGDGDGATDYTDIIQSKINSLRASGGTVYLGNGTYNISKSLILYSNIKVVGTGNTVICQTSKDTHAVVWSGNYISMQDLTIQLSGACEKLTGCIFVNCNNLDDDSDFNTRDDTYPANKQVDNCLLQNVTLLGKYKARKQTDGTLSMQDYRGCGVYADKMYFLYSTFTNIKVQNLYAGVYGGSGANKYSICATECRYAVYGGGRNNMFEVSGHSGYYYDNGNIVGTTEYDCYITGHNNTFKSRVFDSQYNTTGISVYFDPLSHKNTYDVGEPAGNGWLGGVQNVIDHGSINKCLGDHRLVPFAMGQRLRNIQGYCEFKYGDGATVNAIAGAGMWGDITTQQGEITTVNEVWDTSVLPLRDICRYPKDSIYYKDEEAFVLSRYTPTQDNAIFVTIDLQDRPIVSNGGMWMQFDYRYVAKSFEVRFYSATGVEYKDHCISVDNNRQTVWTHVPVPRGNAVINKIVIKFSEALQIAPLVWQDAENETHDDTDYNPDGFIGIVNIGAIHNELYGRAFLGECGGNLYGDVDMHDNTFKNLPTPTAEGDAVPKSYVDTQVGNIETALDSIIAIQNSFIGGDSE